MSRACLRRRDRTARTPRVKHYSAAVNMPSCRRRPFATAPTSKRHARHARGILYAPPRGHPGGAWERWLVYFLRGVQVEVEDAVARMGQIDRLFESWREVLAGAHLGRPREVLRLFAENPFWSVKGIAEELGVAYTTGLRSVERLQAAGIVSPVGSTRRSRVYCARDMLARIIRVGSDFGVADVA